MSALLPKVSILIPTFNQEQFIGACIESARGQSYGDLEIVISDDASTDATENIARPHLADERVRYSRNAMNIGRVANYRRLLQELATGEWVLMLDGDDCLINRDYVAHAMRRALSHPNVALVFGKALEGPDVATARVRNAGANLPPLMDGNAFFLQHPPFCSVEPLHATCLFRRELALKSEFYRADIPSTDFESFYRLMLGRKIGFVDEVAALWRQHEHNASKAVSLQSCRDNFKSLSGPYAHARTLAIFDDRDLTLWRRQGGARYLLFCLDRMLRGGRVIEATRLIGHVLRIDPGILRHAMGRLARRTRRGASGPDS